MKQNLMRWSGNMLRNGARAIALGPRRVGPFIWWCLIDQRLAIWTSLAGPVAAVLADYSFGSGVLVASLRWGLVTWFVLACVMWVCSGRIDASYPLMIYLGQQITAMVKVYAIFRLAQQRWFNRGDQKAGAGGKGLAWFQRGMAFYLTSMSCVLLVAALAIHGDVVRLIGWRELVGILGI